MHLEVRVAGPGLDLVRTLKAGERPVVLGRDPDCDVCLPDPERTVSRRHVQVWLEAGELHFLVLSVVNGVETAGAAVPPGGCGILGEDAALAVGDYELRFTAVSADPWSALDREGAGTAPSAPTMRWNPAEEDPFSDWGFESTREPHDGDMTPDSPGAGDAGSFFRGLGLRSGPRGSMTPGELEAIGRMVRMMAEALLQLHDDVGGVKKDLKSEDRTMLAPRGPLNPLRSDWAPDAKLLYLFGGIQSSAGFASPELSLKELILEVAAHNEASATAVRSAVQSILQEFDPAALKTRLLGAGTRLFESGKSWDAYVRNYEQQASDLPAWTQRQLDRHYTESYLREILRLRRESKQGNG